ncbi:MAG: hypothetical protein HYR74_05495 [Candidatus Eisenbacteria bacterium]|nr:hypothetical protein [Candidatus Eisenbacteria bacterium]
MTVTPQVATTPAGREHPAAGRERPPAARRAAWLVALGADALQLALFPLFAEGFASIANDVLDVAVGVVLTRLIGWHVAFLPALAAELIPGVDLVPTWTAAVWIATRRRKEKPAA